MANDFIKNLIKSTKNEDAKLAEDGVFGDVAGYIDTGSYSLNALLSGSIYNGFASNKRICLSGESGVGKCVRGDTEYEFFIDDDLYESIKDKL